MATGTIVIDAGHGGTGSIGGSDGNHAVSVSGVKEKDLTLILANLVKTELQNSAAAGGHSINIFMTRTTDVNLSLADRAHVARTNHADRFLSIHLNVHDSNVTSTLFLLEEEPAMNLEELVKSNECSTLPLAPLAHQITKTLITSVGADEIIDISDHVDIIGGSTLPYLQRQAGEALIAAIAAAGRKPQLVHALRTLPQQYMVYQQYINHRCGIPLAARPATSPHERAIAIDIQDHEFWRPILANHQWVWRGPQDPAHFGYHGPQNADFGLLEIKAFQQTWNDHNADDLLKVDGVYGPHTEGKLLISPIAGWEAIAAPAGAQ